ncbi:MAG: MFS transporter [Anaerolineae bacterium]|jgi:DHA3 family macrolide efflux protein-like MFS transporter
MQSTQSRSRWQIPFFTIWTGQQLSLIGSRVAQFALVWWLTDLTGSATVLATASMVALIPEILLGPIAGAYVDRRSRRIVMMVADSVVALASLWLAYLFWVEAMQIWHIYAIMLVRALGGSFHWPAMQASTSLMVPEKHLTRVAGLNQTMSGVLNIVGPPLGALLLELLPPHGVMLTDGGTALLAIVPLFFVHIPQPRRSGDGQGAVRPTIWGDIREGLRYIGDWPGLLALIGMAMVVKIALTPAFSLLPLLVRDHFNGGAAQLSLLEAVIGMGIVTGGLLLGAWGGFRRKIYTTLMGMGMLGLGFVVLGLTPGGWLWLGLVCVFLAGFVIPLVDGPIMAILQGTVSPEIQGRVFMLMGSLLSLTSPFGLAIAGPVSDWLGLRVWYLTAGVLCGATGLAGFFIPAIVGIEDNNNGHAVAQEKTPPAVAVPAAAEAAE